MLPSVPGPSASYPGSSPGYSHHQHVLVLAVRVEDGTLAAHLAPVPPCKTILKSSVNITKFAPLNSREHWILVQISNCAAMRKIFVI